MSDGTTLDLVVRALGWALLHSVWQGALVAAAVALLLYSLKDRSAHARYVVACLGLAAMVAAWIGTAFVMNSTLEPRPVRLVVMLAPPVELGPAGPRDRTPAIRVLASADAIDRAATPPRPWRERIEAWSWALVPLWFVGVVGFSTRLAVAWVGLTRLRRAAMSPVPQAVLDRSTILMRRLGVRRAVQVVQSAVVQVPLVVGWLRPIVMLPASALSGLSPAQLESIIAHELAHVRRHDYLVNVLQSVAEALLYYHPACWWISRRIRVEREHCCDDIAVALCGDGVTYATALADLEARRRDAAFALAATDGPLLQRVRRVIAPVSDTHGPASWAGSLAPVAVMLVLLAGAQAAGRVAIAESQAPAPTISRTIPVTEAVLQGRVVEANSARPVAGARVTVMGPSAAEGKTNDDGRFELSGLKPGSYTLNVRARGFVEAYYGRSSAAVMDFGTRVTAPGGRITSGLDVRLESAGSISGRIVDAKGAGIPGVEVELVREFRNAGGFAPAGGGFAQTVADGSYRMTDVVPGDYAVRAYTGRDARHAVDGKPVVYTATFYPGVADLDSAQRLRLYAGQELLDVDFALATSRLFEVAGTLLDPSGQASGLGVILHPMAPSGLPGGEYKVSVDRKGAFRIPGVVPGRYMLNVMDPRRTMRWVASQKTLTVDADVTDIELRAELGASIEGRVVRDAAATATLDPATVQVGFTKRLEGFGFTGSSFPAASDGSFTLESPGGPTSFGVKRLPAGWMVKSVSLDGAEIDDGPIDFGTGRRHVEVVLTDKLSGVSGVVVDRNGRPLSSYSVVLFPPDPMRWHQDSRFLAIARSDNDGRFRLEAVPPGTYLAIAVPALPMGSWQDRSVLEKLQSSAETIRLGEGQQLTISIRASPTPQGLGAGVMDRVQTMVVALRTAASEARAVSRR